MEVPSAVPVLMPSVNWGELERTLKEVGSTGYTRELSKLGINLKDPAAFIEFMRDRTKNDFSFDFIHLGFLFVLDPNDTRLVLTAPMLKYRLFYRCCRFGISLFSAIWCCPCLLDATGRFERLKKVWPRMDF